MVATQKRIRKTVLQLSAASLAFASLGAAVMAAPMFMAKTHVARTQIGALHPLTSGPAIMLAKAAPGESEDCVRVTRVTGPDGKEYPTFGMVCGGK